MELSTQQRIIFVNGCFDILHYGHLQLLSYAKSLGDILVVALDSDENVRRSKPGRPIFTLTERMYMMSMLKPVDYVFSFEDSEALERLVSQLKPEVMVVGSDWKGKHVVGAEHAKEVQFFDRVSNFSSTKVIDSILSR